eukprot:1528106-Rhodomonas_salina.2
MADDEPMRDGLEEPTEAPAESSIDEYVPPSIEEAIWKSSFFRTACTLEMVTLSELAEVDKLEKQVTKLRKLLSDKRLNDQEYADRIRQLVDCEVDQVDPIMDGLKFARDLLLRSVMGTMKELERQADTSLPFPVPSSLEVEEFTSEDFRNACDIHGVTLATVAETERIVQETERLERLLNHERIPQDEYHRNVLSLTGHPPSMLSKFIKERRKAEATLISKIRKIVKDKKKQAKMEEEAKQNAIQKKEAFLSKLKAQIDDAIAKEQAKADLTLMRKRSRLEKLLIQRGIEEQLAQVEHADAHIKPETKPRPGSTTGKTYEYVSKGTAALERKKLFLDHRTKQSRAGKERGTGARKIENDRRSPSGEDGCSSAGVSLGPVPLVPTSETRHNLLAAVLFDVLLTREGAADGAADGNAREDLCGRAAEEREERPDGGAHGVGEREAKGPAPVEDQRG